VASTPKFPDIGGVDSFVGLTMHTARWDHGQDLTGKRVAVIGTGASLCRLFLRSRQSSSTSRSFRHADLVFPQVRRTAASRSALGDAVAGGKSVQRLISPGLRRVGVRAGGTVLHDQPDGQVFVEGRRSVSAQAGRRPDGP